MKDQVHFATATVFNKKYCKKLSENYAITQIFVPAPYFIPSFQLESNIWTGWQKWYLQIFNMQHNQRPGSNLNFKEVNTGDNMGTF